MTKFGRLIQGQDVAFDTHQSGDGQPIDWKELHLEKRLHKGGKIRFPFFGDRNPSSSERVSPKDYQRVVKEVRRTLQGDVNIRNMLAETVVSQIERFKYESMTLDDASEAARKIASIFDLGDDFIAHVVIYAGKRIEEFSTLHLGSVPGTVVEIVQSAESIEVRRPKGTWKTWRGSAV